MDGGGGAAKEVPGGTCCGGKGPPKPGICEKSGMGRPKRPRRNGTGMPGCGRHPGAPAGGPPGGGPPGGGPPGWAGLAGESKLGEPWPGWGGFAGEPNGPGPGGGEGGLEAISRYSVLWWTYIDWMPSRPGPVIRTMCMPVPPNIPVESFWVSTAICTAESL